ncbi:helix-turn-helix transcriptional regulator [Sphingobium sp.]|uniref:helix-turn-helix transcriptional regulator n=1 Tax=Sphingobium sp. TaxID=1912891 RepID=UPI002C2AC0EC|nr:helix-turn-helix transcriptional regulator [Sphingobium sp.]HUD94166.1 helix-turn-helix transcriptional regulator [Sphingobium sp.]
MERTDDSFVACMDAVDQESISPVDLKSRRQGTTFIAAVDDVRPAAEAIRDLARELSNFRVAACANIASKTPMTDADGNALASSIFGWPGSKDQWWKKPLLALSSPLTFACRYESEPFWINAQGIHTRAPNPLLDQIDLSHFRDEVNADSVIVIPIHLPFGQIGVVSFSPIDEGRSDLSREFELYADILEYQSRRFINGYSRVMSQRPWIPRNCRLSKREVECLRWAALGKTDVEIAMILARSCATVRFHIHNAATKLEAVNRSQTVFKATQLGYLGSVAAVSSCPSHHHA